MYASDLPNLHEVNTDIMRLQPGKAPGSDGIPPAIYIENGETLAARLIELMQLFWIKENYHKTSETPTLYACAITKETGLFATTTQASPS